MGLTLESNCWQSVFREGHILYGIDFMRFGMATNRV